MKFTPAAGDDPGSRATGVRTSLTVREAAAWLAVSEDALRRMMRAGRIEWFQTGEKYGYRIPASAVERRLALQEGPRVAQLGLRVRALRDELEGIAQELRGFGERLRRLDDDLAEQLEDGR